MRVKLYTLKEQEVVVEDGSKFINVAENNPSVIGFYSNGSDTPNVGTLHVKNIPIKECVVSGERGYYAFETNIEKLLKNNMYWSIGIKIMEALQA